MSEDFLKATATLGAGGALVVSDPQGVEHVLLVQMNYGPAIGGWIFPGGKIDPKEHPTAAACREVWEETGIRVVAEEILSVRHRNRKHGPDDVYWLFRCRPQDPLATLDSLKEQIKFPSEEIQNARFWKVSEALESQAVRPLTRLYLKGVIEAKTMRLPAWQQHALPQDHPEDDQLFGGWLTSGQIQPS